MITSRSLKISANQVNSGLLRSVRLFTYLAVWWVSLNWMSKLRILARCWILLRGRLSLLMKASAGMSISPVQCFCLKLR